MLLSKIDEILRQGLPWNHLIRELDKVDAGLSTYTMYAVPVELVTIWVRMHLSWSQEASFPTHLGIRELTVSFIQHTKLA